VVFIRMSGAIGELKRSRRRVVADMGRSSAAPVQSRGEHWVMGEVESRPAPLEGTRVRHPKAGERVRVSVGWSWPRLGLVDGWRRLAFGWG
jgi:hypothetical protein